MPGLHHFPTKPCASPCFRLSTLCQNVAAFCKVFVSSTPSPVCGHLHLFVDTFTCSWTLAMCVAITNHHLRLPCSHCRPRATAAPYIDMANVAHAQHAQHAQPMVCSYSLCWPLRRNSWVLWPRWEYTIVERLAIRTPTCSTSELTPSWCE